MKSKGLFSLFITCALLLSAQAAETNHNFAKWEGEIAAYENADRTNPPPTNAVLFVGSSTIRLWKTLASDFPDQQVINRGVGGCEIVDCTHFADRIVFPYKPRVIMFRCGGNDLANGGTAEQVFGDFKDFATKVHGKLPETQIVFLSWGPTPARWKQADKEKQFNALVKDLARQKPYLGYIETYDLVLGSDGKPRSELFMQDQLHLNAEGYRLLAERVRPYFKAFHDDIRIH